MLYGFQENTRIAFESAFQKGSEGLEFDVHLTKDREVVICHDEKIDRTSNGSGYIKDYTLEELKNIDFGAKFPINEEFRSFSRRTYHDIKRLLRMARREKLSDQHRIKDN